MNPSSATTPDSPSAAASESRWFTPSRGEPWRVFRVQPTTAGAADGDWLTFSRDGDKRRLAPVPPNWMAASDEELEAMCDLAVPVRRLTPRALRQLTSAQRDVFDRRATPRSVEEVVLGSELRERVRNEGVRARGSNRPVAESMVHVRRLLIKLGFAPSSPEFRAAARVFLDAYYGSTAPEPPCGD